MPHSAILFDFDGILVDTEWAIYQAWLKTFQDHGHDLPLELYTRCIGSDFDTWSPKEHLEDLTGDSYDWHDLDTRRQEEIVAELRNEGPMPGAIDWLKDLRNQGLPLAVISSSSHHWVDDWLERLNMAGFFNTTVCRGDAPQIKPAPDLYLEAARQLSLSPTECLVIEDSLNGTRSAKAAGMTVWAVPNRVTSCLDFTEADRVSESLTDCQEAFG